MNTKRIVSIICIILVLVLMLSLVISAFGGAFAASQSQINTLKQQQESISKQREELSGQIDSLQDEMNSTIEYKAVLDQQNELNRQEIEVIDEQIALYEDLIEKKAIELEEAKALEDEQKEALRERMRKMEETSNLSYIAILFKATSFTDLLSRLDSINMVMERDKGVEDAYIAAREHVEVVKAEYETTLEEHNNTKIELEDKKAELEVGIEAAAQVISDLEADIERFKAEDAKNAQLEAQIDAQVKAALAELERQNQQTINNGGQVVIGSGTYMWPTRGYTKIGSPFGWRMHPILGYNRLHAGVDVTVGYGVPIVAVDSGTVVTAVYSSSYGNYVLVNHGNGISSLYAHMSSMAVSSGQTVSQGDTLGYVGSTGLSTGAHLHFEMRVNGSCVDPLGYSYF